MERMEAFFAARVEEYDAHMIEEVEGCREAYEEMAKWVPDTCQTLLDLGCGTELELDAIFKRLPALHVTGIGRHEGVESHAVPRADFPVGCVKNT